MKLVKIEPKKQFHLFISFEDGVSGEVDLSTLAGKGVFAAWLEPGVFEQVELAEGGYPKWPGEIDLCPDSLYMQLTRKHPEEVFPSLKKLLAHA